MSQALAALRASILAAIPGLDEPRLVQYRVIRDLAGRLSLQAVNQADDAPGQNNDMKPIEVWPGVPGATSTPTPGEIVVVAFVGRDQYPVVLGRSPSGGPGHTPVDVRLDVTTEIRILGSSASSLAKMRVGSDVPAPPSPVAIASRVADAHTAISTALAAAGTFATAVGVFATAVGATNPVLVIPASTLVAAAVTLNTAIGAATAALGVLAGLYPVGFTSARLEAQ